MTRKPPLLLLLAAALAVPARALIPMASDVVQGILDGAKKKAAIDEGFASPGLRPDPDPLDKYRGLSIKPTENDRLAHDSWVKRQAAQSETADTLLERMSDVKSAGAAGAVQAAPRELARLSEGQFYAFNVAGSAQLYNAGASIKTSAAGLKALYQTLSEQDAAQAASAPASAKPAAQDAATGRGAGTQSAARSFAATANPGAASASGPDAAQAAAQAILPAFVPLEGVAKASAAAGAAEPLPASQAAAKAAAAATGKAASGGVKNGRLESFSSGNSGPSAAALSREGDLPTVKVGGMEDLFNGGSKALEQDKRK